MSKLSWTSRVVFAVVGGMVLAGVMGQGCPGPGPGPGPVGDPVTVELINLTANPVDPFLWADPGTLLNPDEVSIPANLVDIGEPLAVGEVATVTLDCADAGTLLIDGDLLVGATAVPSTNLILLNEGDHYVCGDVVSFYYEIDSTGAFFISADVNDVNIAP